MNLSESIKTFQSAFRNDSVLKEKITIHISYFTDENNTHSKGLDVTSTSWEGCIRKFNKMNLGKVIFAVDKEFSNNLIKR